MRAMAVAAMVVVLVGCPKSAPNGEDAGGGAKPSTTASTSPTGDASAAADSATGATYAGKYTVTPGGMYVPSDKEWANVKFKNDDSKMLGDGEISITVDSTGRVSGGTETGPLGASVIDGKSEGGTISGTIRRKDPNDGGLTGTLVAKISGDALEGTMKLAEFNAAVVREAKFEAKKK
jgi:hypothetical protein